MSHRDGVTETRDQCIDLIISVALNGRVVGGQFQFRSNSERETAYSRLEAGQGASCVHCGVLPVWTAGKENQVFLQLFFQRNSPEFFYRGLWTVWIRGDILIFSRRLFAVVCFVNGKTNSFRIWWDTYICNSLFNKFTATERTAFVNTLIQNYNPTLADAVLDCFLAEVDDSTAHSTLSNLDVSLGCHITNDEITVMFNSQKSNSIARKGENRRIWTKAEFKKFTAKLCSICILSGIGHGLLNVTCDRLVL